MLLVTAVATLAVDFAGKGRSNVKTRTQIASRLAGVGIVGSMAALCLQGQLNSEQLFGGVLVINELSLIFKALLLGLTLWIAFISADSYTTPHIGEYFATLLFATIGMMLLVSSEELITLFVALELTSIALYILTAFHKGSLKSQEAAMKYFMFGAISSAFLLFGISYIFGVTGSTFLPEIGIVIRSTASITTSPLLGAGLLFTLVGIGFKVAVVPFHSWAPDAYEGAPTPVTTLIATGSKVASFFVLTKLVMIGFVDLNGSVFWREFNSGWTMVLGIAAVLSMILGNVVAMLQKNVKRLLAYSSIAHAGYILVGLVAATKMGAVSVLFYMVIYALTNLGAFGIIAVLGSRAGGEELEHFNGMSQRAPFLSALMLIFVLSLAGIPPLGGFFGKFYLFAAAVQRDAQSFGLLWLVIVGIIMSAVSLYYYLVLLKHFYVERGESSAIAISTPLYLNVALALVATAVVVLGIIPDPLLAILTNFVNHF